MKIPFINSLPYLFFFILSIPLVSSGETDLVDSLKARLAVEKDDLKKCELLSELSDNAAEGEWQSFNETLGELSGKLVLGKDSATVRKAMKHHANFFNNKAVGFVSQTDYASAIQYFDSAFYYYSKLGDTTELALNRNNLGALFDRINQKQDASTYYREALGYLKQRGPSSYLAITLSNLSVLESKSKDTVASYIYIGEALEIVKKLDLKNNSSSMIYIVMGDELYRKGRIEEALYHYHKGLSIANEIGDKSAAVFGNAMIARVMLHNEMPDSALKFGLPALKTAQELNYWMEVAQAAGVCGKAYELKKDYRLALEMYRVENMARDSLNKRDNIKSILGYQVKTEMLEKQRAAEEKRKKDQSEAEALKRIQYLGIFTAILFFMIAFVVMRRMSFSARLIDNIGFISVLLLFQFIEVVLNPFIDLYSSGSPIVFMAINFGVASMVKPLHDFIERNILKGKINA